MWLLLTACGDPADEVAGEVLGALARCDRARLEAVTAESAREQVLGRFEVACAAVSSLGALGARTRQPDEGPTEVWSVRAGEATLELGLEREDGALTRMRLSGDAAFQQALSRAMYPELSVADVSIASASTGEPVTWSATIVGYEPSGTTQLEIAARAVSEDGRIVAKGPATPLTAAKAPLRVQGQLAVGEPGTHQLQLSVLDRSSGESARGLRSFEVR